MRTRRNNEISEDGYKGTFLFLMDNNLENDLGVQPISGIMAEYGLKPNDLVRNSTEQITHKMVNRAVKGRRLTPQVQQKILNALNKASSKRYGMKDIFNY